MATKVMTENTSKNVPWRKPVTLEWSFVIPVIVLALLVFSAIFAPILAPYSPTKINLPQRLLPPFFVDGGVRPISSEQTRSAGTS